MGEYFDIVCHTCRVRHRPMAACKLREIALNIATAASVGHFATLHPGHRLELRGDECNSDPSYSDEEVAGYRQSEQPEELDSDAAMCVEAYLRLRASTAD